jgi:hypothetical protein
MQIETGRGEHGGIDAMSLDAYFLFIQRWTRNDSLDASRLGPAFPQSRLNTTPQGLPSRGIS